MSKVQVFLIVLYLFFFGGVGGWVLELLFRRFSPARTRSANG